MALQFARDFQAMPEVIGQPGLTAWQLQFLGAVKQNVELLCGLRPGDAQHTAIVAGDITIVEPAAGQYTGKTINMDGAGPYGFVPTAADYIALCNQVTLLTETVAALLSEM
jgi:hypothetical protein